MNILFVCKHNRFRSRVAEAYFNKINKNPEIVAKGVGVYADNSPLDEDEGRISKENGINISGKPQQINENLVTWADKIVIVADDVDKKLIKNSDKKNIEVWKIKDVDDAQDRNEAIEKTVRKIMKKIDGLVKNN